MENSFTFAGSGKVLCTEMSSTNFGFDRALKKPTHAHTHVVFYVFMFSICLVSMTTFDPIRFDQSDNNNKY